MAVTEHDNRHLRRVVVVGGRGAVGNLFCNRLAASSRIYVTAVDITPESQTSSTVSHVQSDICHPDRGLEQTLGNADAVILAVPESIGLECLPILKQSMKSDALLIDTVSVKTQFVDAVTKCNIQAEVLSINPMFAPSLGFKHQSVACVEVCTGHKTQAFLDLIKSWGADIVMISSQEHDRLTAALQALTHATILAFGLSLKKMGYDLDQAIRLAPPPHQAMLCLMARMAEADPEVYRDIQYSNPHALGAREILRENIEKISSTVDQGEPQAFADMIDDLRAILGAQQTHFSKQCQTMFKKIV